MVQNRLGFKWSIFRMGFEIWTKGHHFVKNHLKFGQKCEDFEWSGFQKVGTINVNVNVILKVDVTSSSCNSSIAMAIAKARPFDNRTI